MAVFSHPRTVLFQEVDAAGVVFFARFFEWFHDAYVAWFASRGIHLADTIKEGVWGLPIGRAEADYHAPLSFGDEIRVELENVTLSARSIVIEYVVLGPKGRHATGKTVHVFVDRITFRPTSVPNEVRTALALPAEDA